MKINQAHQELPALAGRPAPGSRAARDEQSIRESAKEFEAIFLEFMLKSMRDAVQESGLVKRSGGEKLFRSMLDREYAREMASQKMTGLARSIEEYLLRSSGSAGSTAAGQQGLKAYQQGQAIDAAHQFRTFAQPARPDILKEK